MRIRSIARRPGKYHCESDFQESWFVFAHLTARLGALDFDGLTEDREWSLEGTFDGLVVVESDKAKASWAASILRTLPSLR